MSTKIFRAIALLLVSVLLFSFVGCKNDADVEYYSEYVVVDDGEDDATEADSGENKTSQKGSKEGSDKTTKSSGKIETLSGLNLTVAQIQKLKGTTIRLPHWKANELDSKVINAFQKKYGIKVKFESVAQDQYITTINGKIAAGDAPDLYWSNDDFPACLTCIQDVSVGGIDAKNAFFDQSFTNYSTFNGKTYIVNGVGNTTFDLCFYNKKLLKDNNIKNPEEYVKEGNWTWETFEKVMKQVQSLGSGYYGAYIDFETFWGSYGASFYKFSNGTFSSGLDANLIKCTHQLSTWLDMRLLHGVGYDFRDEFNKGKVGLAITNEYGLKKKGYWKTMDPAQVGYTSIPDMDSSTKATPTGLYSGWAICKGAKNPLAAGLFIRYYTDVANFDFGDVYITEDAKNYALKVKSDKSRQTFHCLMTGSAQTLGQDRFSYWKLASNKPEQIEATFEAKTNEINEGVNRLNGRLKDVSNGK